MAYDSHGSLNKVMLIGRLGADPELKHVASGSAFLNISIATNTSWKGENEQKETTAWHKVTAWRKLAEIIAQYAKKGTRVYVEGKLQTRSWDDNDGNKRYTTEVTADQIQILDGGQKAEQREAVPEEPWKNENGGDDLPF